MQGNVNIPDSTITSSLTFRNLVLMNMQQLTNFPYIEKDFDALTDYELLSLVVKHLNDVIANQNEQNDSITSMYKSFLALQTYVNNTKDTLENAFNTLDDYVRNYFDNLDVQEEIDHKLDEYVADGTLEHILASYLQTQKIYNTHQEMITDAANLVDGLTVQTLGYYSLNDGGGSFYHITDTASQTEYQEQIGTLYATMIQNDEVNIKQFGATCDGETDDYNAVQLCLSNLNSNVKNVVFNNKEDLIIGNILDVSGINNITFNFKGKIKRTSATSTSFCFKVWNCKNLIFNNPNIYSTRDQQEVPPEDHSRISPYGSNIIGFHLSGSENIVFNNCNFYRLMSDFYNQPYESAGHSKNVTINNWYSRECSLPLFMQYIDNVYIDKADLIPANDMGGGDHFLYFSHYVDTVFVTNSKFKNNDTNYGSAIQYYNSGSSGTDENCPKNLVIDKCDFNICARVLTIQFSTNAKILNSNIYYQNVVDYGFTTGHTSELIVDNCKISGYLKILWPGGNDANVSIKNCEINNSYETPEIAIPLNADDQISPKLLFINNVITWNSGLLFTSNKTTPLCYICNNTIYQTSSSSQLLSVRKTAGDIYFLNNNVRLVGTAQPRLIYNDIASNNFNVYFNVISGYTELANATDLETINNNYNII